jgi:hypothetical protein
LPFFGQNCSLPFSLRSLDIPALLKSWQKYYCQQGKNNSRVKIHIPPKNQFFRFKNFMKMRCIENEYK